MKKLFLCLMLSSLYVSSEPLVDYQMMIDQSIAASQNNKQIKSGKNYNNNLVDETVSQFTQNSLTKDTLTKTNTLFTTQELEQIGSKGKALSLLSLTRNKENYIKGSGSSLTGKPVNLYVFVSDSLSEGVINRYKLDALRTGAQLVYRGLRPGETMSAFFNRKLKGFDNGQYIPATQHIDPKLFDAFAIDKVPAIVFTELSYEELCNSLMDKTFPRISTVLEKNEKDEYVKSKISVNTSYQTCAPLNDNLYQKIYGSVPIQYALEQFKEKDKDNKALNLMLGFLLEHYPEEKPNKRLQPLSWEGQDGIPLTWQNYITEKDLSVMNKSLNAMGNFVYISDKGLISSSTPLNQEGLYTLEEWHNLKKENKTPTPFNSNLENSLIKKIESKNQVNSLMNDFFNKEKDN